MEPPVVNPPPVYIAANPYEGELCRKALADTGLRVQFMDGIAETLRAIAEERPLVVVIADGWTDADARELLVEVRSEHESLPIFLVEDRSADIVDEEAARRRGASRLFLRPIDAEALAHEIEKLAVAVESIEEIKYADIESIEMEAEPEAPPPEPEPRRLAKIELKRIEMPAPIVEIQQDPDAPVPRVPTEILPPEPPRQPAPAPIDTSPGLPSPPADPPYASAASGSAGGEPATAMLPAALEGLRVEPLLRADEALGAGAGLELSKLAMGGPVSVQLNDLAPVRPLPDRSTFARRLERELSEVERRLFPDAPAAARPRLDEDALSDVDLDSLGLDTIPGIGLDRLDGLDEPMRVPDKPTPPASPRASAGTDVGGWGREGTAPLLRLQSERAAARTPDPALDRESAAPPLADEGTLENHDLCELCYSLTLAGFTGRLQLARDGGERHLYFEAGAPVFATSSFAHDRLGDLLFREGKINREQHRKTRELTAAPGRRTAAVLIELGMLKSAELFPTLRRHVEEVIYSCFAWDSGQYKLGPDQPAAEDRLRLSWHPFALYAEGVRRKYGLQRLVDLVGPPETVLSPTTAMDRLLADGQLAPAERVAAELFDGERTLEDVRQQMAGLKDMRLGEPQLWSLAWILIAAGAARVGAEAGNVGVRAASTLVTAESAMRERRAERREENGRPEDRTIERERLLAKRSQVQDGDYFSVLGLDRDATPHEIDRAFQRLRVDFAPDRFHDDVRAELGPALQEIQEVLHEAHRVLMDDGVRAAYRSHLA